MSIEPTLASKEHLVLSAGEGHRLEFLNHLATVKVVAGDHGSMSVVEFLAPQGFGPPLHNHVDEDELFLVLDGELRFYTGDELILGGAGTCAYLPHGSPHMFQVLTETARFVCVTASTTTIPRFDRMVAELGTSTDRGDLPEPVYIDPARVAEVGAQYGIEIVGPPPPPLPA
jgi:quercetin dioxygenase-like cupin family protein